MSATVIIPTTSVVEVQDSIESVLAQTYETKCYIVCDGKDHFYTIRNFLKRKNLDLDPRVMLCTLPINVGANGFYGHRVYAAFSHLLDTKYVLYLDQDNWFEPDHVKSCIETIESNGLDWSYSLRNICDKQGKFICRDDCESLGKWQTYHGMNHVDTNTYCLKTEIAIKVASVWHGGWGQDRVFLATMAQHFPKFDCTRKYTVNYRVDGGEGSVNADFFMNGNKIMNDRYKGDYPWNKL